MALRIADLGLTAHPSTSSLIAVQHGPWMASGPRTSCSRMASPWTSTRSHPGCDSRGLGRPIEQGEVRPRLRLLLNGREMI